MSTDAIPPRPRNVNDPQRPRRPITEAQALAEPPHERTLPPSEEVDLPNSLPDATRPAAEEPAFTRGPARRPQPKNTDPVLQWASGLQTSDRRLYAGWLVESGKDELFDAVMADAGFGLIEIKHGSGNLVTHWAIETANIFLVAEGVQSIGEMKGDGRRYGIAFGWRRHESGRPQSQLRARVFLRELLQVGYAEPLLLTVKGTLTGDLIAALTRQYDVLDFAAACRRASGKAPELPLYAFSIPLGPGQEVTRGAGSATKEITPVEAKIPAPVTKEHLLAHWTKRAWVPVVENLLDQTIAWSVAESAAIAEGTDQGEEA